MAYPVAEGAVSNSGISIPEIWSTMIQVDYYHETILPLISNTKWEGEIKNKGDKVIIRWRPTADIFEWDDEMEMPLQMIRTQKTELYIDKGFGYNFAESIIDMYQQDVKLLEECSLDQAEQMRIRVEREVFSYIYTQAHAQNKGATAGKFANVNLGAATAPVVLTPTNVISYFSKMKKVLNQQAVPKKGRYCVVDEDVADIIRESDLKDAGMTGDDKSLIRSDVVGQIHGFTVYASDHLTYTDDAAGTVANCFFGHPDGPTFASQFVHTEVKPREKQLGYRTAGVKVYGRKVVQAKAVGHWYVLVAAA